MLLVERGKEPLKGYWSLPGGVLETGETLEEGVAAKCWKRPASKSSRWAWSRSSSASCAIRRAQRSIITC